MKLLLCAALACAACAAVRPRAPPRQRVKQRIVAEAPRRFPSCNAPDPKTDSPALELSYFRKTVVLAVDYTWDPDQPDPGRALTLTLDRLAAVAGGRIRVVHQPLSDEVTVAGETCQINGADVSSIWQVPLQVRMLLCFVFARVPAKDPLRSAATDLALASALLESLSPPGVVLPIRPAAHGAPPFDVAPPTRTDRGDGISVVRVGKMSRAGEVADVLRRAPMPRAVVLDIRGSTGGLLDAVVSDASAFLPDGPLFEVREHDGVRKLDRKGADALDVPLVVLVDRGTASGAEMVAAALRARDRAVIVGEPTLGVHQVGTMFTWDATKDRPGALAIVPTGIPIGAGGRELAAGPLKPDLEASGKQAEELAATLLRRFGDRSASKMLAAWQTAP